MLNHSLARPLFEKKLKAEYADEALLFYDQAESSSSSIAQPCSVCESCGA